MGLPNSSVSVTKRLEVYSWRPQSHVLYTYLDGWSERMRAQRALRAAAAATVAGGAAE